jgi:BMFP domain-containing protein YqiC
MLTHADVCLSQTLAQVRTHKAEMQAQIAELEAQVLTLLALPVQKYKC